MHVAEWNAGVGSTFILDIPGLNLGSDIRYPDSFFVVFLSLTYRGYTCPNDLYPKGKIYISKSLHYTEVRFAP
jgi:hypothetical protein